MLIVTLVVFFSLATIHFSHVFFSICLSSFNQFTNYSMWLRPLSLCVMAACAQYYILSLILGTNLPAISGFVLVVTNALFFIGFFSALKAKRETEE